MKIYTALLLSVCATVCHTTNVYPNVTLEGTMTPQVTKANQMFIYSWTQEEQAICPGAVTALEYCYQRSKLKSTTIPIFTLVFVKPDSRGFRVTHTINVVAEESSSCTMRGGVDTCCEKKSLGLQDQFRVPSDSTAFAVYAVGQNRILGYGAGQEESVMGYQVAIDKMDDGLIRVASNDTVMVEYRMLNLMAETVSTSNNTGISTSKPTVTPFTLSTDEITREPVKENGSREELSMMAKVEIVLGCFVVAVFVASLGLWIYLCHKARKMQRANASSSIRICEIEQPIYEHVSTPSPKLQSSTESEKELPALFHRNPAYAVQATQPEADSTSSSVRRPKLHHDWIL